MELLKKYNIATLKKIINDNKKIKGIYKLKKNDLIKLILDNKFKFDTVEIIKSKSFTKNKFNKYNEEEQKQFEEKGYEEINPLVAKAKYDDKYFTLQEHQKRFIISFLNANTTGCLLFHSVGSGKTLTAAVFSHYYLTLYPNNRVVIISPPSLLYNFVETMKYYGLDTKDNRYHFETYEKFARDPLKYIKKDKTLLIVDEAHNFRTEIKTKIDENDNEKYIPMTNKKGFELIEVCKNFTHKALLLSGTPFVNKLYDIENLASMIDKKDPINEKSFDDMITSNEAVTDYFKYRISHFDIFNTKDKDQFPKVNMFYIPIVMSDQEEKKYDSLVRGEDFELDEFDEKFIRLTAQSENLKSFYNGPRRYIDMVGGNKVNFVINKIKENPKLKSIIYTTFINASLKLYTDALNKNNINFVIISGKESAEQKERSRILYNTTDNYNVLIISKAGTEGVDTKNTRNVFIIEGLWNEGLAEQAIARAVRFRSHISLPEKERYVNVYRLIVCKNNDSDKKYIDQINDNIQKFKKKMHYSKILQQINEDKRMIKINNELINDKLIDEVEKLGGNDYIRKWDKFLNEKDKIRFEEWKKSKSMFRKKGPYVSFGTKQKRDLKLEFTKNYIDAANKDIKDKIKNIINKINNDTDEQNNKITDKMPSIDVYLTIMALAKNEKIFEFVNKIDKIVPMVEDFKRPNQNRIIRAIEEGEDPKKIIKFQQDLLRNEQNRIFEKSDDIQKAIDLHNQKIAFTKQIKEERAKGPQKYNEFFTPENIAIKMIKLSENIKSSDHINVLEPTAGSGNLVMQVIENRKNDYNIDMVEINEPNREILKKICNIAPHIIELKETKNFLDFQNNKLYDLIIMNPPFHLKKSDFNWANRDYWDVDFVLKCYDMLSEGGEIIALIKAGHTKIKDYENKFKDLDMYITFLKDVKWAASEEKGAKSKINKIDLEILQIYKPKTTLKEKKDIINNIANDYKNKFDGKPTLERKRRPISNI